MNNTKTTLLFGLDQNKRFWIIVIVLTILIVLSTAYVILKNEDSILQPEQTDPINSQDAYQIREISDPTKFQINGLTIELNNEWKVTSILLVDSYDNLSCESDSCTLFLISKDEHTFYISDKSPFVTNDSPFTNDSKVVLDINGQKVEFEKKMLEVYVDSEGEERAEDSEFVWELYGCFEDNFCISSGSFSLSLEENALKQVVFNEFLSSLKF